MRLPSISTQQEFERYYLSDIWSEATQNICRRHEISFVSLKRPENSEHIVFLIDDCFVIKIFTPFRGGFVREKNALEFVQGKTSIKTPELIGAGEIEGFKYLVTTQLSGELMTRKDWLTLPENEQLRVVRQLAGGLRELHSHNSDSFDFDWREFVETQSKIAVERQIANKVNPEWIASLPAFLEANREQLPKHFSSVFLHGDVHFGNLLLQKSNAGWQISGLFDFADSLCGFHEYDFLAVGLLMIQGQSCLQREFFKAYGYSENELGESLRKRLMMLTILYECGDLRKYALRLKPEAVNYSLEELEKAIWSFDV